MILDLDRYDEKSQSAAFLAYAKSEQTQSLIDCFIDSGFNEQKHSRENKYRTMIAYNADRTSIAYEHMVIRKYSFVDLLEILRFLDTKDVSSFDKDSLLAVLPNQLHLLQMLM